MTRLLLAATTAVLLFSASAAPAAQRYRATVERDGAGVPHVTAKDWGGLGYGGGYAFAEDNLCRMAAQLVTVRAERSRFFGPQARHATPANEADDTNLASDFFFQRIKDQRVVERLLGRRAPDGPKPEVRALVRGWAAGYNAYLRSGRLKDPTCKGRPWVRRITPLDVWRRVHQLVLFASSARFITGAVAAAPPGRGAAPAARAARAAALDLDALRSATGATPDPATGSNAFAIGRDGVRSGRGLVLSNSHLPWTGTERLWEHQTTIPGKFDVWGASFFGSALVNEGHNGRIAWAHTVDDSRRFTFHRLELAPGDPTSYVVDGRSRRMTRRTVRVRVKTPSGLRTRRHTFYATRFGPVTDLPEAGYRWTSTEAYALGDANADNLRAANTWLELGRARDVAGVRRALDRTQGAPWVHTMAVDRTGRTYYADSGPIPHVTAAKIRRCLPRGAAQLVFQAARVVTLDASRSACGWGRDADALARGTFGPRRLPSVQRTDYVANANNSHWLVNAERPLEGFSPLVGAERTTLSARSRLTLLKIQGRLAGTDGLGPAGFDLPTAQALQLDNRSFGGEVVLDRLVEGCRATPRVTMPDGRVVDVGEACPVLAAWDRRGELGSRGGWLFNEWWRRTPNTPEGFYSDRFDPARPVTTPNQLNLANPEILQALAAAVADMRARGIPLDVSFGEVQYAARRGERIPIHGCRSGCFNRIEATSGAYGEANLGTTVYFVIALGSGGAKGVSNSSHSQATDPTSPFHADGTRRYAAKQWSAIRFTRAEIEADPQLRTRRLAGR